MGDEDEGREGGKRRAHQLRGGRREEGLKVVGLV